MRDTGSRRQRGGHGQGEIGTERAGGKGAGGGLGSSGDEEARKGKRNSKRNQRQGKKIIHMNRVRYAERSLRPGTVGG